MVSSALSRLARCAVVGRRLCSEQLAPVLRQRQGPIFTKPRYFSVGAVRMTNVLKGNEDRYHGVHIDLEAGMSLEELDQRLSLSMEKWIKEKKSAVWLHIKIEESNYIPIAAKHGFIFHHAERSQSVLCKWIKRNAACRVPHYASHQVGAAGCVVREDTKEVLVIQDKHRSFQLWKFPGGLSDLGEDIATTAEREVREETGIQSKFQGVLSFRQQHEFPGAFGRSDIYFLCYMKPLTFELNVDHAEILSCKWYKIDEFESEPRTSALTRRVLQLLNVGLKQGFDKVTLQSIKCRSIHKGIDYQMNHVNVGLPDLDPSVYKHYISSDFPHSDYQEADKDPEKESKKDPEKDADDSDSES